MALLNFCLIWFNANSFIFIFAFFDCIDQKSIPVFGFQGLCLWKWISRDAAPADAFERPKFHTARIMVPTYKVT